MYKILPADRRRFLQSFKKTVADRKTVSDEIIRKAKKLGANKRITNEQASAISLKLIRNIDKHIRATYKLIERIEE